MFLVRRPTEEVIDRFLKQQEGSRLSYEPVGLSSMSPPGFSIDACRVAIGRGAEAFLAAREALWAWQAFRLSWAELHPRRAPMRVGTNVAVLARHLGGWSLNGCRVVSVVADSPESKRCGFAYGTLENHAERGEERFFIELDPADRTVWYEIRAVSRPRALLAWLAYPLSRRLQARFRSESARAMRAAVQRAA